MLPIRGTRDERVWRVWGFGRVLRVWRVWRVLKVWRVRHISNLSPMTGPEGGLAPAPFIEEQVRKQRGQNPLPDLMAGASPPSRPVIASGGKPPFPTCQWQRGQAPLPDLSLAAGASPPSRPVNGTRLTRLSRLSRLFRLSRLSRLSSSVRLFKTLPLTKHMPCYSVRIVRASRGLHPH